MDLPRATRVVHPFRVSPRTPAPRNFPQRPFRVAEARERGVPIKRLRAKDLAVPFHGIRSTGLGELTLREKCEAFALRMPLGSVISHGTAAQLHGMPIPLGLENDPRLHISVPENRRAVDARGIIGHQLRLAPQDFDSRLGLPVTTPERTWCDLAAGLTLPELVAAGDRLLFHRMPLITKPELEDAVALYPGRRGIRALRRALALLSDRAESPRESMLRVAFVLDGLPVPEVNGEVFDARGRFVARVDLLYRQFMIALEYEGDHHRTSKAQWRRDIARIRRLEALGWRVIRFTQDDIDDPREVLAQLRSCLGMR
jgi:hypothetical protein